MHVTGLMSRNSLQNNCRSFERACNPIVRVGAIAHVFVCCFMASRNSKAICQCLPRGATEDPPVVRWWRFPDARLQQGSAWHSRFVDSPLIFKDVVLVIRTCGQTHHRRVQPFFVLDSFEKGPGMIPPFQALLGARILPEGAHFTDLKL